MLRSNCLAQKEKVKSTVHSQLYICAPLEEMNRKGPHGLWNVWIACLSMIRPKAENGSCRPFDDWSSGHLKLFGKE